MKLADFGTTIWCDGYQQDNSPRGTEAFMAPEVNVIELFLLYCSCSDKRLAFFKSLFGLQAIKFQPFFLVVVHVSGHPLKWRLLGRVIWGEDWSSDLLW